MRMRMDDKEDASAPFQDAVLQAMAPIPEDAEYVPSSARDQASTPRRKYTSNLQVCVTDGQFLTDC